MSLFSTFSRQSPNRVFASIILGGLAGASYALLIPIILSALTPANNGLASSGTASTMVLFWEVSDFRFACLFFFICIFILFARTLSRAILVRVSIDMASRLRKELYGKLMAAPVAALERIGESRLMSVLTQDVARIVSGAQLLPDLIVSMVTMLGTLGFLIYLNFAAFVFVLKAIVFGIISYQIPVYFAGKMFRKSRGLIDELHVATRGLVYGAKDLKLDGVKSADYYANTLLAIEHDLVATEKSGFTLFTVAASYGDLISFFVIGIVAFVFVNYHQVSTDELVGVVMALLYVTGPVAAILNLIPQLTITKTSLRNVNRIFNEIAAENIAENGAVIGPWKKLAFSGVCYEHSGHLGQGGFRVGPIDLEINMGEVLFVVGGNGAGKSTLSKLLTLHYLPESGTISFGECVVSPESIVGLRGRIGAIYSDFHLFDRILGGLSADKLAMADLYLDELGLRGKVSIDNGRFSTLQLSDGQRKRLALLTMLLDDRDLYLFDEWAADQDPKFKEYFYRKLLPSLRARGKAVVVISHDDRYFDAADRIYVIENGKIKGAAESLPTVLVLNPASTPTNLLVPTN
jgi:putative ATP-binding cassette transporter